MLEKTERMLEWGGMKRDIICLAVSGFTLAASILGTQPFSFQMVWIAIILCGLSIILEAVIGLTEEFDIKADILVSIALITSVIMGEGFIAGEVAFIMQLGTLLEDMTVAGAREGIEKLVHLAPRTARRIAGSGRQESVGAQEIPGEQIIPAEQIRVGDLLRVLPGEAIPVDGVILPGQISVNQAVMTGELLPVDKRAEDGVSSGTVNQLGSFDIRAARVGEDSSLQRMICLARSADAGKAKIVGIADRWATWIVIIVLTAAMVTWLTAGEIIRTVTMLVIFCPCALVLATPTAIMAAIGNATKHGFFVWEGDALGRLVSISNLTFDEAGTLISGKPEVVAVHNFREAVPGHAFYKYAAGAEQRSEHPLGRAVVHSYRISHGNEIPQPGQFQMLPGRDVAALVDRQAVIAGSQELFSERNVRIEDRILGKTDQYLDNGCTVVFLGVGKEAAGFTALADTLRRDAVKTIEEVKRAGVTPMLLTGDHGSTAGHAVGRLHITNIQANCLPEDKLKWIHTYQNRGKQVYMMGDGVNDAPALKETYIGTVMGGTGGDIAVDAADIVLVNGDIRELSHFLRLTKRMMATIKYSLAFSMTLNVVAVILTMIGILNPMIGASVHNAGSVIVILNSALLLRQRAV